MSSDLFVSDNSFFNDPFSFNFTIDSPNDILQEIQNYNNPFHQTGSSSSSQLENISLSQTTHLENSSNSSNGDNGSSSLGKKPEEFQYPVQTCFDTENTMKIMQRSYSSQSFDGNPSYIEQSQFGTFMDSHNLNKIVLSSPENSYFTGSLTKASSTGDLHKVKRSYRGSQSTESSSLMEETIPKAEPYNAEQRKQRIQRYREKRNHRNFNKTIKYACRKTLADNRARIRGRFARSDEVTDITKIAQDGHNIWMNGFCPEYEYDRGTVERPQFLDNCGARQLQYI